VELAGGGIGHLLCWERHERDGTWYAWVSWVSDDYRNRLVRRSLEARPELWEDAL
jgi:hypothetical protein